MVTLIDRGGRWPLPYAVALGAALLVLSYAIAAALFTYVEMPALRWMTGRGLGRAVPTGGLPSQMDRA